MILRLRVVELFQKFCSCLTSIIDAVKQHIHMRSVFIICLPLLLGLTLTVNLPQQSLNKSTAKPPPVQSQKQPSTANIVDNNKDNNPQIQKIKKLAQTYREQYQSNNSLKQSGSTSSAGVTSTKNYLRLGPGTSDSANLNLPNASNAVQEVTVVPILELRMDPTVQITNNEYFLNNYVNPPVRMTQPPKSWQSTFEQHTKVPQITPNLAQQQTQTQPQSQYQKTQSIVSNQNSYQNRDLYQKIRAESQIYKNQKQHEQPGSIQSFQQPQFQSVPRYMKTSTSMKSSQQGTSSLSQGVWKPNQYANKNPYNKKHQLDFQRFFNSESQKLMDLMTFNCRNCPK